ncbi:MAG: DUF4139 domain-containing protein [Vulcanimicrobiota bacterium]
METLTSRIESVTIYHQTALVERVAELSGPGQVRLDDLPLSLDETSVRAAIEGEGLVAVSHRVEYLYQAGPWPDSQSAAARSQQRHILMTGIRNLEARAAKLGTLSSPPPSTGQPTQEPTFRFDLDGRRLLLEVRNRHLSEISRRIRELRQQVDELAVAEHKVQQELAKGSRLTRSVVVTVAGQGSVGRLKVSYQVPGVLWAPAYTFRFDRDLSMVELLMRVAVCQTTGEPWMGVNLRVATSQPTGWKEVPELASRRIGRHQPGPAKAGWRPPPTGVEELYRDYARLGESPPAPEPEPEILADLELETCLFDREETDLFEGAGGGAADDLFGSAPAGAMAAAMPPAPPRAAPTGGLARLSMGQSRSRLTDVAKKRKGPPSIPRPEPEPAFEVGSEHLAYSALRMPGPDEPGRGRLTRQDPVVAARRAWVEAGSPPTASPDQLLGAARQESARALQVPLPSGYRLPQSIDGFDYLYCGQCPVDVPSGADYHTLPLATHSLTAEKHLVCVPRVTRDVFRRARVESLADLALPAGPADLMVGGDYLLSTTIGDVVPGSTLELGLGVEQGVKVARNVDYQETTAGMMGGTLQLHHSLHLEVANRTNREVTLEVRERLPVATEGEKEIQVIEGEVEPAWEALPDGHPGQRRWVVRLAKAEERVLQANYRIDLSSKLEVVGGNRREE